MAGKIAFVHTVPALIDEFNRLGAEILPGTQFVHILDEAILEHIHQNDGVKTYDTDRLRAHVDCAEKIHADAVLVTCSVLSTCIDELRPTAGIPIIKIDEALVELAVATGEKIGMLATNPDTLKPSAQILYVEAARVGKTIMVVPRLVEHAFAAIRRGDGETHDGLVKEAILELAEEVDVIVLAQASMARVLALIPEGGRKVPILSSPHLALGRAKQLSKESSS